MVLKYGRSQRNMGVLVGLHVQDFSHFILDQNGRPTDKIDQHCHPQSQAAIW